MLNINTKSKYTCYYVKPKSSKVKTSKAKGGTIYFGDQINRGSWTTCFYQLSIFLRLHFYKNLN